LNLKRDDLWDDAKIRLETLANEAVIVLSQGLHSEDQQIAVLTATNILKCVGLYDSGNGIYANRPKTPEEVVCSQMVDLGSNCYIGVRPDAFSDLQLEK
jgi:hypothetical protein